MNVRSDTSATPFAGEVSATSTSQSDWFGHPRGLSILFLTEMWEKFSYFGMRALLVYYMTKALAMPQSKASLIYGSYTAFAYFTPILGGLIADRLLGRRIAVIVGGTIMAIGHFLMAYESLFYPALITIALGNGLFLPSLPSQVQTLYRSDDPRRVSAYNVYYVGINLGAIFAPLVCGTLGELYGWHWGFGAAGVGMCIGVVIYIVGGRYLPAATLAVSPRESSSSADHASFRRRIGLLLAVVLIVIIFRGAYEQIGNTFALLVDSRVDRQVGDWTIPSTWFQALNPLLVLTLTPLLLLIWRRGKRQGTEIALRRMAIGALVVAFAFALLAMVMQVSQSSGAAAHWSWLVVFLVIYTLGELFILPTGLALFGQMAPAAFAATMIALWFSASFAGNLFAGAIGALWSRLDSPVFLMLVAAIAIFAAALLLVADRSAHPLLRDATSTSE